MRPGDQLASTACTTRVVVIRAPAGDDPALTCGGAPMAPGPPGRPAPSTVDVSAGTQVGKRYTNTDGTLELLCTASGAGELCCDGTPMTRKTAKPLPASD
ncbi:MAG TPA: hypothetical protein VJT31_03660 [Rugosimonospora sp.]|nr:hypothetical protein [Rugosimonospora sp.]